MRDHQPNLSVLSPLAAAVCSGFYPDGVSVELNSDYIPRGQPDLTRSICTPGLAGSSPTPFTGFRGSTGTVQEHLEHLHILQGLVAPHF